MAIDRREFIVTAAALGAAAAWSGKSIARSGVPYQERRDLFPQGVASGDPDHHSVMLWTRRPFGRGQKHHLIAQVALDPEFRTVVASVRAPAHVESDWTCRVLVGGLQPESVYWYRFTDETGAGSRIGRTITAPLPEEDRTARFAFVSCQSVNEGAQNAYRRMLWEDRRAPADKRLGFVLHLGDFIYEVVEYPHEIAHRYDRTVFDIGQVPNSRKVGNFHVPTDLAGYRVVYRAHIDDPDIQDARAWLPFVCIGDNHEFSWQGWQSFIKYDGKTEPAQALRVAANQAWWEYIPSRVRKSSGSGVDRFGAPAVRNAPIPTFDADGFGDESNNRRAVESMTSYRSMRYGRHLDLILTDLHSFAMEDPTSRAEADAFSAKEFPLMFPEEILGILDGGTAHDQGKPPAVIKFGGKAVPNFRKDEPPFTILGRRQKEWLKQRLRSSSATWKIWAATNGTLDMRIDPLNLPEGLTSPWPGQGYATLGGGDFSAALRERAEIYDFVRDHDLDGFVVVSGDRHSFWAGYAAKALPPSAFAPVGLSFITGSISAPGLAEAFEHGLKGHPLRDLFDVERDGGTHESTINLTLKHGVRSALEYARTGDVDKARALTNGALAPHVEFVDMGGHGYSIVTAEAAGIEAEFVCIPRPVVRSAAEDGGPLRYRVRHAADRWKPGEKPALTRQVLEGDPKLSV